MRRWTFIFIALLLALPCSGAFRQMFFVDTPNQLIKTTSPVGMSYDAAGQITNIWEQMANSLPIAWFRFGWGNAGTMGWEFAAPLPHAASIPTRTMSYDADNRLSVVDHNGVTMDDDGNLISGPMTNDSFESYTFDARNRLQNVGGVTNTYDSAGNRVGLNCGTNAIKFVVNPNAALPQVLMRIKNGVTNYYIYGAGLVYQITETATGTNTLTYHYDYRGSTIALSADSGLVTDRMEYSAYGITTYRVGASDTPFLFNGRYGVMTDPNGLVNMRARYYSPFLCRFISSDPSGFNGGLNLYAYANGNPVSYIDPFGLGAVGESAIDVSWYQAPTPYQQEMQDALASFLNFVTLGVADLASKTFEGQDIYGNQVSPEAQNEAAIYLVAMCIPGLDVEGVADCLAVETAETLGEDVSRTAAENSMTALTKFYPDNSGFSGTTDSTFLMPGQTIDRYGGSGYSQFFSPQGTPDWARSLPPGTAGQPLRTFQVMKPFEVQSGTIAPWFNQPGGGIQYLSPVNLGALLKRGVLQEITR